MMREGYRDGIDINRLVEVAGHQDCGVSQFEKLVHDFTKIFPYIKIEMSKLKCQTRPPRLAGSHGGQVNVKAQSSK
jgi:hypothetical protein